MSLSQTYMSSSVFQTCLTHAFSTEREEVKFTIIIPLK